MVTPSDKALPNPKIKLVPCKSSNIHGVGYDASSRVMEIIFHGGGKYRFYGIPPIIWENLIHAKSMGNYFGTVIRGGGFKYKKLA